MKLCSFSSGSGGNCFYVENDKGSKWVIDSGISRQKAEKALRQRRELGVSVEDIKTVFITHEHEDHAGHLETFPKAIIYGETRTLKTLENISDNEHRKFFHLGLERSPFEMGTRKIPVCKVSIFSVPHRAVCPVGYRFDTHGKSFGIVQDLGSVTPEIIKRLRKCDAVAVESNWDSALLHKHHPKVQVAASGMLGHLSNDRCRNLLDLIVHDGLKHVFLLHVSKTTNAPLLAMRSARKVLPLSVNITACPADGPSAVIEI